MNGSESFPDLNKFRIIELDNIIPVSFYGKILQDFSGDVTLIKSIAEKRNKKPKLSHRLNRRKKIVYLDPKKKEHKRSFQNYLEKADILLDNKTNGFLERHNIELDLIRKINPKLIILLIEGNNINSSESKLDNENINLADERDISYMNSLRNLVKFFKNKDHDNKKYVNPLIILSDLFDGTILSLSNLARAIIDRKRFGKGSILSTEINVNLNSLAVLSEKMTDKNTFSFSCNTKNLDYILFSIDYFDELHKSEDMNIFLKKICERLYIEVLNYEEISEGLRLTLIREYIDYFQLITKNINDSIKHIKDLCRLMDKDEILEQLKRFEFLDMHLIKENNDLFKFYKNSKLVHKNYIIDSLISEKKKYSDSNQNKKTYRDNIFIEKEKLEKEKINDLKRNKKIEINERFYREENHKDFKPKF